MCPPTYYRIEYEINPWMRRSRPSNHCLAQEQWQTLYRVLQERLHARVSLIEPRPDLPDMVFTANGGLVWKNKFIVSNFRHRVRRGEAAHFANWFASGKYEIFNLSKKSYFEGEGDLLMCADVMFAGCPIRSSAISHRAIAEILELQVRSLRLTNRWFYHLDTCFCPLSPSEAIYYPGAFDADALKMLAKHVRNLIPVEKEEAYRFACNAIAVDKKVIINQGCPKIRRQLEALGFAVYEVPLTEFIKAGGSAKCLVLKIAPR
jgi:N-dimethylarginine dimethylaminohydrolase